MGSVESTSVDPDKPKEGGSECKLIGYHRDYQPRHDCQRDRSLCRAMQTMRGKALDFNIKLYTDCFCRAANETNMLTFLRS